MRPLAQIRFGYGPRAGEDAGALFDSPEALLAQLATPDPAAEAFTRPGSAGRYALLARRAEEIRQRRASGTTTPPEKASALRQIKEIFQHDKMAFLLRPVAARNGFAERLTNVWANRLTVGQVANAGLFIEPFRQEVARAHMAGHYADMLRAALWHPAMQVYLTQTHSIGPNSGLGRRKGRGLNENLAREFLELHSMGQGYSQTDVTELARLLAGMQHDENGRSIRLNAVEPGPKTILGQVFTDDDPLAEIDRMVAMVAAPKRPARWRCGWRGISLPTAPRRICWKALPKPICAKAAICPPFTAACWPIPQPSPPA